MRLGSLYETCCKGGDDSCPTCGIPNYGQDHNYADAVAQGEDPATHKTNLPALTAAKMSNGTPHPWVVNNGINGRGAGFDWDPKKDKGFKTLYGEREDDAFSKEMQESVDVCRILSGISLNETNRPTPAGALPPATKENRERVLKAQKTYEQNQRKLTDNSGSGFLANHLQKPRS